MLLLGQEHLDQSVADVYSVLRDSLFIFGPVLNLCLSISCSLRSLRGTRRWASVSSSVRSFMDP